jgi:hypothetical protein
MKDTGNDGGYREGLGYALWCLFFVGLAGIHRIYLGKYGTGILWLLTFGLFGIGQIVDLFSMKRLITEANIRAGYLPHPRVAQQLEGTVLQLARELSASGERAAVGSEDRSRSSLRHRLLKAAIDNDGTISVTEGVAATDETFEEVERTLRELVQTGYVDVDNAPDTGVVIYRFTEFRHSDPG